MEPPPTATRNSNTCGGCAMGRSAHLVRKGFSDRRFPAKNPPVRRLFRKLLLFLLLMAGVYVFWPRFPSLEGFRPPMIAALECEVFAA
jgi:hypothetical protein